MPGTLLLVFCRTSVEMDSVCAYLLIYVFFTQGPYWHLDRISPSHIFSPQASYTLSSRGRWLSPLFHPFGKGYNMNAFRDP